MHFLKNLKGPIGFIAVSMFLNVAGFTVIIPVIPFIIGKYVGVNETGFWVGIIISVYALCQFIAAPALGALSDKVGRRPVLLISLFGSVIGYIIFGIGGALWVLFLGRIIDGLTGGNLSTMFAYVADITEPKDRGRYYGILGAVAGFGFMVGPAIGGLAGELSFVAPLYVAAFVTFLCMLWGYFVLPESLSKEKRSGSFDWSHLNPFLPFSHVFTSRALIIAFGASFLFFFGGTMMQSNISVFLKDLLSFGPGGIGAVLFVVGIIDIVSQGFLTGKLLPIFGEVLLARVGLFINAIGFLMLAAVVLFPTPVFLFVAIVVFNIGDGLFQPAANGIIANAAPHGKQGSIQGANQGQQSIARVLGPLAAAFLYPLAASGPYIAGAVVVFLGFALLFVLPRNNS